MTKRTAPPIEEAVYIHAAKDSAVVERELEIARKAREAPLRRAEVQRSMNRPCQNCPSLNAYDGQLCGDCGVAYAAVRECKPCARNGLHAHACSDCGGRTTLPYVPNALRCACDQPPSTDAWCTLCGGKSYSPILLKDDLFDADPLTEPLVREEKGDVAESIFGERAEPSVREERGTLRNRFLELVMQMIWKRRPRSRTDQICTCIPPGPSL